MRRAAVRLYGPQPVPELPIWGAVHWENGFREVVISDIPCNWFQCQGNSCDPVHFGMDA
jgi:5,5'-dehydrodivanillate O-demethylase